MREARKIQPTGRSQGSEGSPGGTESPAPGAPSPNSASSRARRRSPRQPPAALTLGQGLPSADAHPGFRGEPDSRVEDFQSSVAPANKGTQEQDSFKLQSHPRGICRATAELTCPKLFPDHPSEGLLQGLSNPRDVVSNRRVEQSLVVAAAGGVGLLFKPLQKVVVDADRDPCLAGGNRDDRPALCLAEVVFFSHLFAS